jgi:hypothetical protein
MTPVYFFLFMYFLCITYMVLYDGDRMHSSTLLLTYRTFSFMNYKVILDMMSRGYVLVYVHVYCCNRVGHLGESGTLKRERRGEGHSYSEVPRR